MHGETPREAMDRAATHLLDKILEPGCTLSPPHDLLENTCVRVDDEWLVFRRMDEEGRMVLSRAGSACEWTHVPDQAVYVTATPF